MTARPIVVATDGSEDALRAVEWAAREAVLHSVPLRIVSAASLPKMVVLPLQSERDAVLEFVRDYRDRALAAAAALAAEVAPGLLIDTDPVEGPPALAVTGSGPGALMLVTGSRGIGAFTAMVLGSVAQYAADHARCPVVVVPSETAAVHRTLSHPRERRGKADMHMRVTKASLAIAAAEITIASATGGHDAGPVDEPPTVRNKRS